MKIYLKVILVQVIIIILIMSVFGVISFLNVKRTWDDTLENLSESVQQRLSVSLIDPLWDFDTEMAMILVDLEMGSPHVSGILIEDPTSTIGKIRGEDGTSVDFMNTEEENASLSESVIIKETEIIWEEKSLATLRVYLSDIVVRSEIRKQLIVILIQMVIVVVLLTFSSLMNILAVVNKPLNKVCEFAIQVSLGDLASKLDIKQKDEIGQLADSLKKMTDSLRHKETALGRIATGDLTVELEMASENDQLGRSLIQMQDSLTDLIMQISESVGQVQTGADQVSQSSQVLSLGATNQAASLEEISASINEISGQSRQNTEAATAANSLAKQAADDANKGNEQMAGLTDAMGKINSSSDEIKKIVKVIDNIAFQTNLLALNANVEAARAGKYGKGFAVVANEVRNLAVRSAEAVKETTEMVDDSIKNIDAGNKAVEQTAAQLHSIMDGSSKVADFLEEIAVASKDQAEAINQISQGLDQIDQVTQSNTASAEESAAASEELSSQSVQLKNMIATFKLKNIRNTNPSISERVG